jgi:hypothetical protein
MTDDEPGEAPRPESVEELAEDAKTENPDLTTQRETFELELMEERRSKEGEKVELAKEPGSTTHDSSTS